MSRVLALLRLKRVWVPLVLLAVYGLFGFLVLPGILRDQIVSGVRAGLHRDVKLTRVRVVSREVRVEVPVARGEPFVRDQAKVAELGLTPRELDILEAMAAGLSNKEIAERLFVSENTVKTHAARLFSKLSARRRTQAVQLAKEAGLIP